MPKGWVRNKPTQAEGRLKSATLLLLIKKALSFDPLSPRRKTANRCYRAVGFAGRVRPTAVYDFQVEALQRRNMRRSVRKQANLADVQIGKDLPTQANLAQNPLVRVLRMLSALAM